MQPTGGAHRPAPLLTPAGLEELRTCMASRPLLAFDFDGTLAPIVDDPDAASLREDVARTLERLAQSHDVCVISGRARDDVRRRVPSNISLVVGNHGIEHDEAPGAWRTETARRATQWREHLARELAGRKHDTILDGVWIEDKILSLALHYRNSPSPQHARDALLALAHELRPEARIVRGKMVLNIVPPELPHKGTALRRLMRERKRSHALFVGDDDTDEDVFALSDPAILTIRIGESHETCARFILPGQREILVLLERLIEFSP